LVWLSEKIQIAHDPEHGSVIICFDTNEADELDDYLVARDVSGSVRFLEDRVEFFVPSVAFEQLADFVSGFITRD
jgi:hypothetical protein